MDSNRLEQIQKTFEQISYKINGLSEQQDALIDIDLTLEKTRVLYDLLSELKLEKLSQKDQAITQKASIKSSPKSPKIQVIEEQFSTDIDDEALKLIEQKEHIDSLASKNEKLTFVEETISTENQQEAINNTTEVEFIEETIKEVVELVKEKPVEIQKTVKAKTQKVNISEISSKEGPVKAEEKIIVQEVASEPKSKIIETNDTVADQFEVKASLNDILSEINSNDDFATQLRMRPIPDLRNAISLNDKIWFTRELFSGNNDKFKSSLESINNSNTMQEAIEVADTFGWDKKESSTKKFLELIYRRFI